MYCTVNDMINILPENITIGDQNIGSPSPGRPQTLRDSLTPAIARKYIQYAQEYIDARLRPYYLCPLRRIKSREWDVLQNITRGLHVPVVVFDATTLVEGENVRVQDKTKMETCTIESVTGEQTLILASVTYDYNQPEYTTLSVLEFPDPIPVVCTRFAVSFLIDRLFVAEQSPDISEYSKTQRNLARNALEDVLTGVALLYGQEHTGKRFVRMPLLDSWASPSGTVTKGEDAE